MRAHLRYTVKDRAGNVVEDALAQVFEAGTVDPVEDLYTAAVGGAPVTTLVSNAQGEIEGWVTLPKSVDLLITDNGDTAHYPGGTQTLSWAPFTERLEVLPAPEKIADADVLAAFILQKGALNGLAPLGPDGKVPGAFFDSSTSIALAARMDAAEAQFDTLEGVGILPMLDAKSAIKGATPRIVDAFDGVMYGHGVPPNPHQLHRSLDSGATWELVKTFPDGGAIQGIRKMGNGEVVVSTGNWIYRSTGWAVNPLTAVWTQVVQPTAGASFINFGFSAVDNVVLVGEYVVPRDASKKLRVSTDYGVTFNDVLNLDVMHPGLEGATHWHATAIDPWADTPSGKRLWASHGDGPRAILYSDDLGATWTTLNTTNQPTTLTATPYGMVASTDEEPNGVYRILRKDNPADMTYEIIHELRFGFGLGLLYGFASDAMYDPDTGLVFIAFNSRVTGFALPALILASNGITAAEIYRTPQTDGVTTRNLGVANGVVNMAYEHGGNYYEVVGSVPLRGSPSLKELNSGGILGGKALQSGIAIGVNTNAKAKSVLIGEEAAQSDSGGGFLAIAIGNEAKIGSQGVAIGRLASALFTYSTALGNDALIEGSESVAVGRNARVRGAQGVGVGASADAWGLSVAVGYLAKTTGQAVAVGPSSEAATTSVAIGAAAKSKGAGGLSVAVGNGADSGTGQQTTAIGSGSSCGANSFSMALGRSASSAAEDGVAIGRSSSVPAGCNRSVALGQGVVCNTYDQVRIGLKHIEIDELAGDYAAPAADRVRIYCKDNGAGKTGLYARFATGAIQQIALEP